MPDWWPFPVVFSLAVLVVVALCVLAEVVFWAGYRHGRNEECAAQVRRRARRLHEHPEWPMCDEMHRRA